MIKMSLSDARRIVANFERARLHTVTGSGVDAYRQYANDQGIQSHAEAVSQVIRAQRIVHRAEQDEG